MPIAVKLLSKRAIFGKLSFLIKIYHNPLSINNYRDEDTAILALKQLT